LSSVTFQRKKILQKLASLRYCRDSSGAMTEVPFGELFEIWAESAFNELSGIAGSNLAILSFKAADRLKAKLVLDLSSRCSPTLAALLHIAKLEHKLYGGSSRDNYLFYIEKIFCDPAYQNELFAEFAPLARTIADIIRLWIEQAEEFLRRINQDLEQIIKAFSSGKFLGKIADLSPSLSDFHQGNRSVYRIEFETGLQIIYKPKPLALDAAYNQFLKKLDLGLKTYRILDQDEYGWVEFIETLPCQTEQQIKNYFEELGMLISLMFILEGTDCHYENIIASAEHPVLIDLESLFHPTIKQPKTVPKLEVWNHSVFRTGFLPSMGLSAQKRIDISPLTADEEQELPRNVAKWHKVNTDEMQLTFVKKKIQISVPRPKYNGKTVSIISYISDLLRGFEKMYRRFMNHKIEILSLLEDLFLHPVRFIFRPTELYFQILQRLTDPKLMRLEKESEKTLDILTRFSALKESPYLNLIAQKEKESLLQGDIPFFLSSPSDTALYLGKEKLALDFFETPSKERVLEKVRNLNESDLRLQLQYIDHSLYYLKFAGRTNKTRYTPYDPKINPISISEKQLLSFADQLGEKILALSQPLSDGTLAWISLEFDPIIDRYVFQPLSTNLYSGTAGIAFFLAILGKVLKKTRYENAAERLFDQLIRPYREEQEAAKVLLSIGAMSGAGGAIYCFSTLSKILHRSDYLQNALQIASFIDKKNISEDRSFDLISGSAGLILSLISLYKLEPKKSIFDLAVLAGDHLIENGKTFGSGIAWETIKGKHLCGLSHGASGIAYSLLKLYEITRHEKYLETAKKGLAFESALYSQEHDNWPDLRTEGNFSSASWCHGSPGIALSRLYCLSILQNTEDLDRGILSTIEHMESNLDHLCCGNFGRISVLWSAGKILGREDLKRIARNETARHLKRFKQKKLFRLYCDLPEEIQSPGLMQGLAGIGYFLLRLSKAGDSLPEILMLD
jgi:type 2 lantibiotic biosynthesis protein LanM